MKLSLLALAACTAINYVSAAPMSVVVISTPKFNQEVNDIDAVRSRFEAALAKSKFVPIMPGVVTSTGPHIQVDDEDTILSPFLHRVKLLKPSTDLDGKKHKGDCGPRKGKHTKMGIFRNMRVLMNKLRAALGLPIIHYHHEDAAAIGWNERHSHPQQPPSNQFDLIKDDPGFGQYAETGEAFIVRFTRAVNTLSPFESRAISFVLGIGLGALIRMLVVFAILIVRGRKAGRFCERRRARREARRAAREAAALNGSANGGAPPAYADVTSPRQEKRRFSVEEALVPVPVSMEKTLRQKVVKVITIDEIEGSLKVFWESVNGETNESPASDFHLECPEKLLEFYEANLRFRPNDEEVKEEV